MQEILQFFNLTIAIHISFKVLTVAATRRATLSTNNSSTTSKPSAATTKT